MATNALLELQKKFNLFQVGDKLQGNIVSVQDNAPQLKLAGGALGFISSENNKLYARNGIVLKVGNTLDVEVCEMADGIPFLKLPDEFVRRNSVKKAIVKFSGTRALVVEFLDKGQPGVGLYSPQNIPEQGLQILNPGTMILCKGVNLDESGEFCTVEEIKVDLGIEEGKPAGFEIPAPWDEAEMTAATVHGSVLQKGVYRLGEVYVGKFDGDRFVVFDDKTKAMVKNMNQFSPVGDDYLLVRIIKICDFGDFKDVEVLRIVDKAYVKYFKKVRPKQLLPSAKEAKSKKKEDVYDCGFNFSKRDNAVFNEGVKAGSPERFEKYWLGFLYKAEVFDGVPVFTYNNGYRMNVKLLENDDVVFMDGQIVFCRLYYIENNKGKVTLTVRPEFCKEKG